MEGVATPASEGSLERGDIAVADLSQFSKHEHSRVKVFGIMSGDKLLHAGV